MKSELLNISGLSIELKEKCLLSEATTTFNSGEVVLLEGGNGTGKTTFLKSLLGLQASNCKVSGIIQWTNYGDVLQMSESELQGLRAHVAYLEQKDDYSAFYGISVKEVLADSLEAHLGRKLNRKDYSFIEETFKKYCPNGVSISLKSKINKLSGGQQRLVSIIASLCMRIDSDVFIIDEPLNNLDISTIVHISNLLNKIRIERPEALMIIISHCKIFPFINKVVRIDNQRISESNEEIVCNACFGKPDELGFY